MNKQRDSRRRRHDGDADKYFIRVDRKTEQLRVAIEHALRGALACDIDDPLLESMELLEVVASPGGGGTFTAVLRGASEARARDATPVFREALARELNRKHVPQVTFVVIASVEVTDA